MALAYLLQPGELVGAPQWMSDERYDVNLKFDPAETPNSSIDAAYRSALRALLAQRFKLALHRETRDLPTYSLMLDRPDRGLGKSLRPSSRVCDATFQSNALPAGTQRPCGAFGGPANNVRADAISMPVLARFLSSAPAVQRMVVDRTGLTGSFDVDLTLSLSLTPADNDDSPNVFTALKEQLGLALVPSTTAIEVIVVDHVERPTDN
jgi:uncharacterized protein (TIGR03435 family)